MGKKIPLTKQCCEAMIQEGITDPVSRRGMNFCTDSCPYDHCVIIEPIVPGRGVKTLNTKRLVLELKEKGLSVKDIARTLKKSKRTIERYLE